MVNTIVETQDGYLVDCRDNRHVTVVSCGKYNNFAVQFFRGGGYNRYSRGKTTRYSRVDACEAAGG